VEDHPIVREGLRAQLTGHPDFMVCGEAEDIPDAIAGINAAKPDLVLIDISLKGGNGLDLIKRLKLRDEQVPILVWSMYPENLYAERSLRCGAMGYVHKGRPAGDILDAIRTVLGGKVYLSEDMSAKLLFRAFGTEGTQLEGSVVDALTDRELEAFELLGQGLTTQQIAEKMHVSPKTVETYRARIKEKLHLNNASELIQRAVQWVVEQS